MHFCWSARDIFGQLCRFEVSYSMWTYEYGSVPFVNPFVGANEVIVQGASGAFSATDIR